MNVNEQSNCAVPIDKMPTVMLHNQHRFCVEMAFNFESRCAKEYNSSRKHPTAYVLSRPPPGIIVYFRERADYWRERAKEYAKQMRTTRKGQPC